GRRNLRYPLFEVFDRPDSSASCPRRNRSTTATQALTLLNSEFSLSCARDLAKYVVARGADETARIDLAYRRVLGRKPTTDEFDRAKQFVGERANQQQNKAAESDATATSAADEAALTYLCLALFNLNEFIYAD